MHAFARAGRKWLPLLFVACSRGDPASLGAVGSDPPDDAGMSGDITDAAIEPGCDAWSGPLSAPADFTGDEMIGGALSASLVPAHLGAEPPQLEAVYCATGGIVEYTSAAPLLPGPARFLVREQPGGTLSGDQQSEAGDSSGEGALTGSGNSFTLWLDSRFTPTVWGREDGFCPQRDALVLSGEVGRYGVIAAEAVSVILSTLDCGEGCPGAWQKSNLILVPLGDCPSCDQVDPICGGQAVEVCTGTAASSCTSANCDQVLGCNRGGYCQGTPWWECSHFTSEFTCDPEPGCSWNYACRGWTSCSYGVNPSECGWIGGCTWTGSTCDGVADPCSAQGACLAQGCYEGYACDGTATCSGISESDCNGTDGCYWTSSCSGTPTPCDQLPVSSCTAQPGCQIEWVEI
jgi:hypothetical protein